jgi:phosphate starvation-inducible membrane PsiE
MPPVQQLLKATTRHALTAIRADAGLYLAIVLYTLAGLLFLRAIGAQDQAAYQIYFARWAGVFLFLLPALALIVEWALVLHRFDRRRNLVLHRVFAPGAVSHFLAGTVFLAAFVFFQGTFTSLKNALPVWRGDFLYDRVQADIDRFLHFGIDPWRYLFAIGETDLVRTAIEWNYNVLWFALCFGGLFFATASPRARHIRTRYIACFMLVWIVCGNLLAGLFISAGPAFYGAVTGDAARFGEQLAFLAHGAGEPNSAASYQEYLWMLHQSGRPGFGSGISAFPSVHVGLVAMNALFVAEHSRRWGTLAFAYVALIMASSVYLAWHYAIDGYVSVAVVAVLYFALRRVFAAAAKRSAVRAPAGVSPDESYSFLSATSSTR